MYSGLSLHDEIEMLAKHLDASPTEILRNATIGCARLMKLDESLGTVDVGKLADLILLDADPLEEIGNTRKIDSVFAQGKFYTRQALDQLLSQVAESAQSD